MSKSPYDVNHSYTIKVLLTLILNLMKISRFLIFIVQIFFFQLSSTQEYNGLYCANKNKHSIDNIILLCNDSVGLAHLPRVLSDCYYSRHTLHYLIKDVYVENQPPFLMHINTKYAKSGYLFVNDKVSHKLMTNNLMCDSIKYYMNNVEINNCKSADRFLKLKMKCIKDVYIKEFEDFIRVDVYVK